MDSRHFHILTSGCQMNVSDSEHVAAVMETMGWNHVSTVDEASLVVLNTCSVRERAEDKVRGQLGALQRLRRANGVRIAMTGCMVTTDDEAMRRAYPSVDLFFKTDRVDLLVEYLRQRDIEEGCAPTSSEDALASRPKPKLTHWVTVMYGCNHVCTFCIVPFRRGRERSRTIAEVVEELRYLVAGGTREVTLLGQNVDDYGRDLPDRPDFADLLTACNQVEGLWRIRFMTSHPSHMTEKLIATMPRLERLCPHVNLPVQAGDDDILRRMKRGYTAAKYVDLVGRIRAVWPRVSFATDIIVGFPGETAEQFQRTLDLLETVRCDVVHVAAYSPRPGTVAGAWPDDVSIEEKSRRLHAVEDMQARIAGELNHAMVGSTVEALVDGAQPYGRGRQWRGRTDTNKLIFWPVTYGESDLTGSLATLTVAAATPWSLQGRPLANRGLSLTLAG